MLLSLVGGSGEELAKGVRTGIDDAAEAVASMPRLTLSADQVAAVAQGKSLAADDFPGVSVPEGEVVLLGPGGELVAIAVADGEAGASPRRVHPRRVLAGIGG